VTQLDIFAPADSDGSTVRTFTFADTGDELQALTIDGGIWIVAPPLARAIGHRDAADMIRNLDTDEKGTHTMRTPGGEQRVSIVSEAGMYRILATRRAGAARNPQMRERIERFQRWVFHEVIPAAARGDLNKGRHEIPQSFADALQLAADQQREIERQQNAIADLEPRAEQADHFRKADGLHAVASFCNDLQLWAWENHRIRLKHEQIRDFLGDIDFIIRTDGIRKNEPKAEAIKAGWVRPKHSTYDTNTRGSQEATSARLTPKGWGLAWDKAVRRIAAHGSLEPAAEVVVSVSPPIPQQRSNV
jgi:anti-repressor protein